jgi:hypothetical protein
MKHKRLILAGLLLAITATAGAVLAQRGRSRGWEDSFTDPYGRWGVPMWENDARFKDDVFTFVRVQYSSYGQYSGGFGGGRRNRGGRGGRDSWDTDFPQSDLNFSYRLQQLTSFKVNPIPVSLRLTDEALFDYPFIYLIEPGRGGMYLSEAEIVALRRYLLNGGFLMVDDFWGDDEWYVFYEQIKRVFPDREPIELPITHEIFQCVYKMKEKPQVPAFNNNLEYLAAQGITWENHGPGSETPHFRAIFDDKGRMMAIICHNTDLGDGWEREGNSEWYFHNYCENKAYPMGINIVTYALTH